MFGKYQRTISCCSVMPQEDTTSYEYQPETPISVEDYEYLVERIKAFAELRNDEPVKEDVDKVHVDCANGACPIDFNK